MNRTPIVGLKKFRFDDRRCGSFVCVRIEGDVTTTGSGARRWSSSSPEPARTRLPAGLPYRCIPRETGSGCTGPTARRRSWRRRQQTLRLGDEGRRGARPRRERSDQDGGHGQARDREHRVPGALVPRLPVRRRSGRSPNRRASRSSPNRSRTWKNSGPAGVQVTRRERSAVVRLLAGRGHRLDHLLRIAGLPKSTYYHHLSRPAHVSRPDVEPMVREIWDGSTSTNGGGTSSDASASASP